MSFLSDATVRHLKAVAGWPELTSDRYFVIEEIGRGGMGTVYAAHDTALGRDVAIKIGNAVPSGAAVGSGSGLSERLTREAQVIARLEHPGIVPVHDYGLLADGRPFYVMKRVDGQTLQSYLDTGPALAERLRVFERVCEAVSFAHAHGILHRDLKPSNVMVGGFGEVMVMDWGVAVVRDRQARTDGHTATGEDPDAGTVLGTRGFMPPEQAAGHSERLDERADVYALGAMLYALLTGHAPPQTAEEAIREIGRAASVPAPLRSICRCALAPVPANRYPSVKKLTTDVAAFRAGQAVSVHREGPIERATRFVRTYQTPILLVLAYILMRALIALFAGV
jgi:serine/threonine protein kinase